MANTSILAAFERMWQHVVSLVGGKAEQSDVDALETSLTNKADADHTHVTADGGFAHGTGASATTGGAVGYGATATSGGAVGKDSSTGVGGVIGAEATSSWGGAVGGYASATTGGAVGYSASTMTGGAVGNFSESTSGFSGGNQAKSSVNSIQLGTGTNTEEYSLQVYSKQLMNGDGYIPTARLISHSETIINTMESQYYEHTITKTWTGGIPIVRSVNWTVGDSTYGAANVVISVADNDFANQLKIRVQRPTGVGTATIVSYCLQIDVLGI